MKKKICLTLLLLSLPAFGADAQWVLGQSNSSPTMSRIRCINPRASVMRPVAWAFATPGNAIF